MRKIVGLFFVVVLFACSQKQEGYKIEAKIEGAEGKLMLERRGLTKLEPVDTVDIVNGKAIFEGKVDYPQDYYLSLMGQRGKAILFIENTKMMVTGKVDSLNKAVVTGSKVHDEYKGIQTQIQDLADEYMDLYQRARQASAAGDTTATSQMMNRVRELYGQTAIVQKDFIKQNPSSYVVPFFLLRLQQEMEVDELETLLAGLDPKLDEVETIQAIKGSIAKSKLVAVGQIAPDFTMNNLDGQSVRFSDIYSKNKLTLLDFWAGWCGPCRQENPNVVKVYNDFKGDGFDVFGVSLDRNKDEWVKAIKDDKLTWNHVSDLSYWNNAAAKLYLVNSIPSNLLVDSSGKIIAKNKRGEELRETVAEFLK